MTTYYVLGLMSGTSLDGLDLAYVRLRFAYKQWTYKIIHAKTIEYSEEWREKLNSAIELDDTALQNLDEEYSSYLAELTKNYIFENNLDKLDLIASHGHTIKHLPDEGITYQIGNTASFGEAFQVPVVCDFRTQDVALGGQGAPLVPIGDEYLFSEYNYCLNLGGIANISYEKDGKRMAYDIAPANIVLNYYANKLGQAYDKFGRFAMDGKLDQETLNKLNSLEYYKQEAPKSLGKEWVFGEVLPILENSNLKVRDILHTYCQHLATQINQQVEADKRVLITGGGAYNKFLIGLLDEKVKWRIPEEDLVAFKEALIFALLGVLRFRNQNNCLASYTGASKDHSSGKIYHPKE